MERTCKNCGDPIVEDHDGNWTHDTGINAGKLAELAGLLEEIAGDQAAAARAFGAAVVAMADTER